MGEALAPLHKGVALAPLHEGEALAPLHATQAPVKFVVHSVVHSPTASIILEQQNLLEELRRKGRPLDLQWQGVEGRIFAGGMKRDEPLMMRPKRLEFPPSGSLRGFPPESASQKWIKAYKAHSGPTLDDMQQMREGRKPRITMTDAKGEKIVFKSCVERVTTVLDYLDANPLPPMTPVRPAKTIPTLTAAQKVREVARVKFEECAKPRG